MTVDLMLESLPKLKPYAQRLAGHQNYRDLLQDTFEHAWRKRRLFRPGGHAAGWLSAIMRNKHLQSKERYRRKSVDAVNVIDLISLAGVYPDTAFHVVQSEQAIARLSPQDRDMLVASALGEPYPAMANRLCMSKGAVYKRIRVARKKLEKFL